MDELIQGSEEWLRARAGSLGASQVSLALAKTRSGWGASRENVKADLVTERLTGEPTKTYINDAMRWGIEMEPRARVAYALSEGVHVEEVGLVRHPRIKGTHASPDGLVGSDGLVEIKCPQTATHLAMLRTGKIESKYLLQMQWQMICTGRVWCDFVSYDPRLPNEIQLYIHRVHLVQDSLEDDIYEFIREVDQEESWLRDLIQAKRALDQVLIDSLDEAK